MCNNCFQQNTKLLQSQIHYWSSKSMFRISLQPSSQRNRLFTLTLENENKGNVYTLDIIYQK